MLKTRTILALIGVCFFFLIVALLALYYSKSPLKTTQQEALRRECEDIMFKMTRSDDCDQKMSLYNDNLNKCRHIYDSAEKENYNFRLDADGLFFDRILTNSLCYAQQRQSDKAKEILKKAQYTAEDMITIGATGCEPSGFFNAFISSLDYPSDSCLTSGSVKDYFLKALNENQFQELPRFARRGQPISLDTAGETHFECPSPVEDIQSRLVQFSSGKKWELSGQEDEGLVRKVYFRTRQNDQILLLINVRNNCEYLTDISALAASRNTD